jgi:hypothetical protein
MHIAFEVTTKSYFSLSQVVSRLEKIYNKNKVYSNKGINKNMKQEITVLSSKLDIALSSLSGQTSDDVVRCTPNTSAARGSLS